MKKILIILETLNHAAAMSMPALLSVALVYLADIRMLNLSTGWVATIFGFTALTITLIRSDEIAEAEVNAKRAERRAWIDLEAEKLLAEARRERREQV